MNIIKKIFVFFLLIWSIPALSFAANIFFSADNNSFPAGEDFLMEIFMDTEGEGINAVEGKLVYTNDLIEIKEIRDGSSSINFWIERPRIYQPGIVVFSGITPGGVSGKNLLFGIVFHAQKTGQGSINFDETKVLKNDGEGTPAEVRISNFQFSISAEASALQTPVSEIKDIESPEDFRPIIGNDPEIFGGKYFLVFVTQDKGIGMDRYEVREGFWGKYVIAESPYLLENQSLNKKIYVKAIDKAQNERVVTLKPDQWKWYQQYALLIIILVLAIALGFVSKKIWRRSVN